MKNRKKMSLESGGGDASVTGMYKIWNRLGDGACRECINKTYHVHLKRRDCLYGNIHTCQCCMETHHGVVGFTLIGKLKMLFK